MSNEIKIKPSYTYDQIPKEFKAIRLKEAFMQVYEDNPEILEEHFEAVRKLLFKSNKNVI